MRVSVTELEDFQDCEMKHHYRHGMRLRPLQAAEKSIALVIGGTVARAIEVGVSLGGGVEQAKEYIAAQKLGEKFEPKAIICVEKLPQLFWDIKTPNSEDKLEVQYGTEEGRHTMVGIPDLWWVEYDEDDVALAVHVEEFKTGYQYGSQAVDRLMSYQMFGIQASRYAVMLHDKYEWLRGLDFYRRHTLMSYAGRGKAYKGDELLLSKQGMDRTRMDMLELVDRMASTKQATHHFARLCDWCAYAPICRGYLTNSDPDEIIKSRYGAKPRKENHDTY